MRQPGDKGVQGIDIEQLEPDPDISLEEAIELAEELGADPAYIEYTDNGDIDWVEMDHDFVERAIDFRHGDVFFIPSLGHSQTISEVFNTHPLKTSHPNYNPAMPGINGYCLNRVNDWLSYDDLWLIWLGGGIVEVERTTTYTRADTGDEVEV